MPDDLYDRDALAWAERQAALLRRVARGESVNDVDWNHVVEEIEDVGISQLSAVHSYLRQVLAQLLKLHGWPDNEARRTGETSSPPFRWMPSLVTHHP
jgi:hypothetical protein